MNKNINILGRFLATFDIEGEIYTENVDQRFVKNHGIDVVSYINSLNRLEQLKGNRFKFEYHQQLQNKISISEISENGQELRLSFESPIEKEQIFNYLDGHLKSKTVYITNRANEVVNVVDDNETVIIVLRFGQEELTLTDTVNIFVKRLDSEWYDFTYIIKNIAKPTTILKGNKTDNLQNFNYKSPKRYNQKSYGDVKDALANLSPVESIGLNEIINIDFSDFSKHVRFGSANSKVTNTKVKIDEGATEYTPYERWVLTQIRNLNSAEKELWFEKQLEEAMRYDAKNNDFLLYHLPRYFMENDEFGYLTNFVLFIGEFFDNIFILIRGMDTVKELSLHEIENISPKLIEELLQDLGFDLDVRYSEADFKDFFESEDNLLKISNEVSARLINTLPHITKMKGTRRALDYVFNIFGINRDLFSINEYGSLYINGATEYVDVEKEWFLQMSSGSQVTIDVSSTDIDWNNHTIQIIAKNLSSSGTLLTMGDAELEYSVSGGNLSLTYKVLGATQSMLVVPYDGERIVVISVSKNIHAMSVSVNQKSITGEIYSSEKTDFSYASGNTFTNIVLRGTIDLTEFRVFDSPLTMAETEYHTLNIRSTSEDNPSTLHTRFYFRRGDLSSYTNILGETTSASFTNITEDNFTKFSVRNITSTNSIFSNDIHSDKIRIRNVVLDESDHLSFKQKKARIEDIEFVNDPPIISVHLSQADIVNRRIIESVTKSALLNPEWNSDYDYNFVNLISLREDLGNSIVFNNTRVIDELYELINLKMFNVLRMFIPESVEYTYGMKLKNSIVDKVKEKYAEKSAIQRDGWTQVDATTYTIKKSDLIQKNVVINIGNDTSNAKKSFSVQKRVSVIFKTDDSKYIESITGYEDAWKSPFLRRTISGTPESSQVLTPEQLREFLNFGARILVI